MFNEGVPQTMDQILTHREIRVRKQQELLQYFKNSSLVVLTLNIPGPIKNNIWLSDLFQISLYDLKEVIEHSWLIDYSEEINQPSGIDSFIIVSAPIEELKRKMIEFEEIHPLGRLLDIDIFILEEDKAVPISRQKMDCAPRKCFICEQTAKSCARSRKHTLEELETKILVIYEKAKRRS